MSYIFDVPILYELQRFRSKIFLSVKKDFLNSVCHKFFSFFKVNRHISGTVRIKNFSNLAKNAGAVLDHFSYIDLLGSLNFFHRNHTISNPISSHRLVGAQIKLDASFQVAYNCAESICDHFTNAHWSFLVG